MLGLRCAVSQPVRPQAVPAALDRRKEPVEVHPRCLALNAVVVPARCRGPVPTDPARGSRRDHQLKVSLPECPDLTARKVRGSAVRKLPMGPKRTRCLREGDVGDQIL